LTPRGPGVPHSPGRASTCVAPSFRAVPFAHNHSGIRCSQTQYPSSTPHRHSEPPRGIAARSACRPRFNCPVRRPCSQNACVWEELVSSRCHRGAQALWKLLLDPARCVLRQRMEGWHRPSVSPANRPVGRRYRGACRSNLNA
jgi:hypothetical protein